MNMKEQNESFISHSGFTAPSVTSNIDVNYNYVKKGSPQDGGNQQTFSKKYNTKVMENSQENKLKSDKQKIIAVLEECSLNEPQELETDIARNEWEMLREELGCIMIEKITAIREL